MAAAIKFKPFVGHLGRGIVNMNTMTLRAYWSNATMNTSHGVKVDFAEISTGNGYAGPVDTQNTFADSDGVGTLTGTAFTTVASGGAVGPLRYLATYWDEPTSPADPLCLAWDVTGGGSLTLQDGDSIQWRPSNSGTTGTVGTLQ